MSQRSGRSRSFMAPTASSRAHSATSSRAGSATRDRDSSMASSSRPLRFGKETPLRGQPALPPAPSTPPRSTPRRESRAPHQGSNSFVHGDESCCPSNTAANSVVKSGKRAATPLSPRERNTASSSMLTPKSAAMLSSAAELSRVATQNFLLASMDDVETPVHFKMGATVPPAHLEPPTPTRLDISSAYPARPSLQAARVERRLSQRLDHELSLMASNNHEHHHDDDDGAVEPHEADGDAAGAEEWPSREPSPQADGAQSSPSDGPQMSCVDTSNSTAADDLADDARDDVDRRDTAGLSARGRESGLTVVSALTSSDEDEAADADDDESPEAEEPSSPAAEDSDESPCADADTDDDGADAPAMCGVDDRLARLRDPLEGFDPIPEPSTPEKEEEVSAPHLDADCAGPTPEHERASSTHHTDGGAVEAAACGGSQALNAPASPSDNQEDERHQHDDDDDDDEDQQQSTSDNEPEVADGAESPVPFRQAWADLGGAPEQPADGSSFLAARSPSDDAGRNVARYTSPATPGGEDARSAASSGPVLSVAFSMAVDSRAISQVESPAQSVRRGAAIGCSPAHHQSPAQRHRHQHEQVPADVVPVEDRDDMEDAEDSLCRSSSAESTQSCVLPTAHRVNPPPAPRDMAPSFIQRSGPSAAAVTLKRLREATYAQLSASPERTSDSWHDIPTTVTEHDAVMEERRQQPPQPRPFDQQPVRPASPSPSVQRLPQVAAVPSPPLATRSRTRSRSRQQAFSQQQYLPAFGATVPLGRPLVVASNSPAAQRAATVPQPRPSTRSFFFDPTKVASRAADRPREPRRADSAPGREGRPSDRFVAAETCVNFVEPMSRGGSHRPAGPGHADGEAAAPLNEAHEFSEYQIYEEDLAPRVWPRGVPYPKHDFSGAVAPHC